MNLNRTTQRHGPFLLRLQVLVVALLCGVPLAAHAEQVAYAAQGAKVTGGGSGALVAFWVLGALTFFGALATITRRNPVMAALYLVLTLFCTGGLYLVLHATFLAAIQVLVYAGAIMVLFVFVVMAVRREEDEEFGLSRGLLSKVAGLGLVALLLWRLVGVLVGPALGGSGLVGSGLPQPSMVADTFGDVKSIGKLLFTDYLFPFEAISILLLAAIVGAVVITRFPRGASAKRDVDSGGGNLEPEAVNDTHR